MKRYKLNIRNLACFCLAYFCLTLVAVPQENKKNMLMLIDDFETNTEKWIDESAVEHKPTFELSDNAKVGKKSMKIVFPANTRGGTSIANYLKDWHKDGTVISFWGKAEKESKIQIKVNELVSVHNQFEGFSAEVIIKPQWTLINVPLSKFTYLWGHGGGNKKTDPERIRLIAFEQSDVKVAITVWLDDVAVNKSSE